MRGRCFSGEGPPGSAGAVERCPAVDLLGQGPDRRYHVRREAQPGGDVA